MLEGSVEKRKKIKCGRRSWGWRKAEKDMMGKGNTYLKTVHVRWNFLLEDKVDRPSSQRAAEAEENLNL